MAYLKPNVVLEPLYQQWYAWPHLISPATAAMNVLNRHIRIMDSYLQAPSVHERFARETTMIGGPFMGHTAAKVDEVRALRDRTKRDYGHIIDLANAIGDLRRLLNERADGYSLNDIYADIPDILRGYVELCYDLDNRPTFRFFESLLYRSRFYDTSAQSVALYIVEQDKRPFVLSTPRLSEDGVLHLHIPFTHPGLDSLFRMRSTAGSYEDVRDMLGIGPEQEPAFQTFFTETALPPRERCSEDKIQLRYFGHACMLLETANLAILTDPVISSNDHDDVVARDTYKDLPDQIDYVLITHNHQDHILFETLLQLRHKIGKIIVPRNGSGSLQDPSLKLMFNAIGFHNVVELDELEILDLADCTVTGVPFVGEHADLNIHTKLCYHVKLRSGFAVIFAADSCNVEPKIYQHVHRLIGDVDVLFLGMECDGAPLSWLYGPLLAEKLPTKMDQSRRLAGSNYARGMALVNQFNPSGVYVYAMGQEPWLRHVMAIEYTEDSQPILASNALVADCQRRGIQAKRLFGREVLTHAK